MSIRSIICLVIAFSTATFVVIATAQSQPQPLRPSWWPNVKDKAVLTEWYSDVPWHQKLGSYAANEIVVPLIFPYEVLPDAEHKYCSSHTIRPGVSPTSEEDCMIEAGVANILGYQRFDTLYDPQDQKIQAAGECAQPNQCLEVRLEVSNFVARSTGANVTLQPEVIGHFAQQPFYGGFYITDGSTYAPQMLWEMSHYCDSKFDRATDMKDPVCYADYFSPMNDGFQIQGTRSGGYSDWPRTVPWSVYPTGVSPPEPSNGCKPGETKCVIALGGFALGRVPAPVSSAPDNLPPSLQFREYNKLLLDWFNNALVAFPAELGPAELQNHFPWNGKPVAWDFIHVRAVQNPFLGSYTPTSTPTADAVQPGCDTGPDGPLQDGKPPIPPAFCTDTPHYPAASYVYPRYCTLDDLASAIAGSTASADQLRQCGLNYEIHPNGWLAQWPTTAAPPPPPPPPPPEKPPTYQSLVAQAPFNYASNQYGRTSFIFGGVRGMQMPVSFMQQPLGDGNGTTISIYEQVHNASIFSLFLPAANIADVSRAMGGRNYADTGFYHTLLMSNHMESDPEQFAEGIRGKVLWHNEYRMEPMYDAHVTLGYKWLKDRTFQAAFDPLKSKYDASKAPAPFHNNTCDGCHVRNGSGVPINTAYTLDKAQQEYMSGNKYVPYANGTTMDYTFTGKIRPMKLVFFDLQPNLARLSSSRYSDPLNASAVVLANAPRTVTTNDLYYNNKIMNFYGDSFHVSPQEGPSVFNYRWTYTDASANRLVVSTDRRNKELNKTYKPQQIRLGTFTTPKDCQLVLLAPTTRPWPTTCEDIDDKAIHAAIDSAAVGYMHVNGKRLGNLSVIEAIPNQAIIGFQKDQQAKLGGAAGEIIWNVGSRDGVGVTSTEKGKVTSVVKKDCRTNSLKDCFIGRFGFLGNRVSLEDQVANAAFVEMNMTSSEGYDYLNRSSKMAKAIRYKYPNCGAANKACVESKGNSDLSETDIKRMADYARWLGNPTRSEIQVSQPEVIAGEKIFRQTQCDTCHVINRIDITDPDDTMLSKNFRDRLATRISGKNKPFLSYIGTDLLMHDMGYLSQVADTNQPIRDTTTGMVKPGFETFVQKIRTPPLKGLRFNNYVTDAHRNTKDPAKKPPDPGCDFLLHDGRACSAIEAAFLHDGPAIKQLQVIEKLNALTPTEVMQLRAFLYSL